MLVTQWTVDVYSDKDPDDESFDDFADEIRAELELGLLAVKSNVESKFGVTVRVTD